MRKKTTEQVHPTCHYCSNPSTITIEQPERVEGHRTVNVCDACNEQYEKAKADCERIISAYDGKQPLNDCVIEPNFIPNQKCGAACDNRATLRTVYERYNYTWCPSCVLNLIERQQCSTKIDKACAEMEQVRKASRYYAAAIRRSQQEGKHNEHTSTAPERNAW